MSGVHNACVRLHPKTQGTVWVLNFCRWQVTETCLLWGLERKEKKSKADEPSWTVQRLQRQRTSFRKMLLTRKCHFFHLLLFLHQEFGPALLLYPDSDLFTLDISTLRLGPAFLSQPASCWHAWEVVDTAQSFGLMQLMRKTPLVFQTPSPAPTIARIWGTKQQVEHLFVFLSLSLCLSDKLNEWMNEQKS